MNKICVILNEFKDGFKERDLNAKKIEIEKKYSIELNLKYYEHTYNGDNNSYYYYHIDHDKVLYLYFRKGNLVHVSVKTHGKDLCSKDF